MVLLKTFILLKSIDVYNSCTTKYIRERDMQIYMIFKSNSKSSSILEWLNSYLTLFFFRSFRLYAADSLHMKVIKCFEWLPRILPLI